MVGEAKGLNNGYHLGSQLDHQVFESIHNHATHARLEVASFVVANGFFLEFIESIQGTKEFKHFFDLRALNLLVEDLFLEHLEGHVHHVESGHIDDVNSE